MSSFLVHPHLPCTEDSSHAAAPARILGSIVRNAFESALHAVLISQCICRAVPILHFVDPPLAILGRLHPLQAMAPLCSIVLSAIESALHAEATVVVLFCHFCVVAILQLLSRPAALSAGCVSSSGIAHLRWSAAATQYQLIALSAGRPLSLLLRKP